MITRYATLGPAPTSVRWARVVCPLVMCFAYLTLRVAPATHDRVAPGELITSGVLFVGLTFLAFIALGDLIDPAPLPPRLEDGDDETQVFGGSPAEDAFDWGRIEGDLLAALDGSWPGRAEAKRELIARAYGYEPAEAPTEELELLTHEYVPQHHTPPRGFAALVREVEGERVVTNVQARPGGRHRAKD